MSHLPPVGWADLTTRRDLDALRIELRGEFAEFPGELRGELHKELNAQTKTLFVSLTSVILSVAALVFAALQLT